MWYNAVTIDVSRFIGITYMKTLLFVFAVGCVLLQNSGLTKSTL